VVLDVADFDFNLPDELIAQEPPGERGGSRLLVMRDEELVHDQFANLGSYLRRGDLLVVNDTRVFPARLLGRRVPSGGAVECLLVRDRGDSTWEALMHPGQKLKPGADSTSSSPPFQRTIFWTIESPIPVERSFGSICRVWKILKMRAWCSGAMPTPSSRTAKVTRLGPASPEMVITLSCIDATCSNRLA
jgi:S-adenosylmethionine:tRNA-ribosyltransferase-isomerase (queuine synthetase)